MPNQNDIRQAITNQIISALESGNVPALATTLAARQERWGTRQRRQQEVVSGLEPDPAVTSRREAPTDLEVVRHVQPVEALGGKVMRRPADVPEGQWGCQICFWTPVTKTVQTDEGDEEDRFFVLRMYTVFCVDQVEGKHLDHLRAGQADTGEPLTVDYQPAEDAIEATGASHPLRWGQGVL